MLCMLCGGSGTLQEAGHVEIEGWHAGGAGLWGFCVVPFSAGRASLSPPCLRWPRSSSLCIVQCISSPTLTLPWSSL